MQRVANCILIDNEQILMLQKPKKGWWFVPGGKMESGESIQETVQREFLEETNLTLIDSKLRGVFTIIIQENNQYINEWMMFTFLSTKYSGEITKNCKEGHLRWININNMLSLPKAKGDNIYLDKIVNENKFITGKFIYTTDYELKSFSIDSNLSHAQV